MHMHLHDEPFNLIKSGSKIIEMRLNDEKRQLLKENDIIEFESRKTGEIIKATIIKLHHFKSFNDLYQAFDKEALGYLPNEEASPSDLEIYYPKEEQAKYGVVGIEFKVIKK